MALSTSDPSTSTILEQPPGSTERASPVSAMVWVAFVVVVLLLLDVVDLVWIGVIAPAAAAALVGLQWRRPPCGVRWVRADVDRRDLTAVGTFYVAVVALFAIAFEGFGTDRVAGLFLSFAAGLIVGVVGPVVYMVWRRGRSLTDLGIGGHRLRETLALGVVLAGIQFAMTLWGYDLPEPVDWVPLLVMSLASRPCSSGASSRVAWKPASGPHRPWPPPRRCMRCTTWATAWAPPRWASCSASASSTPSPTDWSRASSSCGPS